MMFLGIVLSVKKFSASVSRIQKLPSYGIKWITQCNQQETGSKHSPTCWLFAWVTLQPWGWKQCIPLNCQWTSTRLHGVTPQRTVAFMLTAVRNAYLIMPIWKLHIQKSHRYQKIIRMPLAGLKRIHSSLSPPKYGGIRVFMPYMVL
jgi:hypothetical protein